MSEDQGFNRQVTQQRTSLDETNPYIREFHTIMKGWLTGELEHREAIARLRSLNKHIFEQIDGLSENGNNWNPNETSQDSTTKVWELAEVESIGIVIDDCLQAVKRMQQSAMLGRPDGPADRSRLIRTKAPRYDVHLHANLNGSLDNVLTQRLHAIIEDWLDGHVDSAVTLQQYRKWGRDVCDARTLSRTGLLTQPKSSWIAEVDGYIDLLGDVGSAIHVANERAKTGQPDTPNRRRLLLQKFAPLYLPELGRERLLNR